MAHGSAAEVVAEVSAEIVDRVCVRISPASISRTWAAPTRVGLFGHVLDILRDTRLSYLHLVKPDLPASRSARR